MLTRSSWGDTSIVGFYVHMWPASLTALVTVAYLRLCRLLRPTAAKLWSWELILFQLLRWPWTFWGFLQGLYAGARSRVVSYLACAPVVVILHLVANRERTRRTEGRPAWNLSWSSGGAALAVVLALVIPTTGALVWRFATYGLMP